MGGLSSTIRGQEMPVPALRAEDALARECGQEELPVEVRDARGRTALHLAVETGDDAEVRRLLAEGAAVGAADDRGRTALMAAAAVGNAGLCALLADAGADLSARDRFGQTALHLAAGSDVEGAVEVVRLLLRRGAGAHVLDGCRRSGLTCALQAGNLRAAGALAEAVGPLLQKDDTGRTELHWAAANGTAHTVRLLLARATAGGLDRDSMGHTPLTRALHARNGETAAVLAAEAGPCQPAGADVFGRTALHWAAYAGYPEVVRQLLRRDFSPWVADQCGRTALHYAVESGHRQIVEEILDGGDYRECADERGQTALHAAALRGDAAVAALLLDRGADTACGDSEGRTPLMYALRGGHKDTALLLAARGKVSVRRRDHRKRTALHWAAVGGDVDCVRDLLARGAPVNAVDDEHKTPAALAVEHEREAAAEALVAADGFCVMMRDCERRTALHGAAAAGWTRVAMHLLARGADAFDGDGPDGVPPYMVAMRAGHFALAQTMARYKSMVKLLHPFLSRQDSEDDWQDSEDEWDDLDEEDLCD